MEKQQGKFSTWLKTSITARMLVVGLLILALLIPLSYVQSLIQERAHRQEEVIQEINDKWGHAVLLSGPILKVPYTYTRKERFYDQKEKRHRTEILTEESFVYLFPDNLSIDAHVKAKPLHRSIYKSVVYNTNLSLSGHFSQPDFSKQGLEADQLQWDKASIVLQTSNLKGIRNQVNISLGDKKVSLLPKYNKAHLKTLESDYLTDFSPASQEKIPFSFALSINGSKQLEFIPIGKTTQVSIQSNWHSPSFMGNFLPEDGSREISADGFKAAWKVLQINREFEQIFKGNLPDLQHAAFGTKFIVPVDEYQKSERTAKYGLLVIGLTLVIFLLIQIISKLYIHPFQYLMVGLALVMFYTLLIAISEHSSYLTAYLTAGTAVVSLISFYAQFIFRNKKFVLLIFSSLAALYSFIYVIIQLENYALLVGSVGLFIILASIMVASRKIDWEN